VHLAHRSNRSRLNQLHHAPIIIARMNLRTHLRHALMLARRFPHDPAFGNGVRKRLLAVNMASALECSHCCDRMRVIRSPDHERIDIISFEHPSKIVVLFAPGYFCAAASRNLSSTSQSATMFWLATWPKFQPACAAVPTIAIFSFSLGESFLACEASSLRGPPVFEAHPEIQNVAVAAAENQKFSASQMFVHKFKDASRKIRRQKR